LKHDVQLLYLVFSEFTISAAYEHKCMNMISSCILCSTLNTIFTLFSSQSGATFVAS